MCLVAIPASAASSSLSWWEENPWADPDRGFNWYPDPREELPPEKAKPEEKKPKTIYEMTTLEEVKKELERLKGEAVINPTEKNVLSFLRAQNLPEGDARALTPRESEVLLQISKGFTVKEIARLMGMKGQMVNEHIRGAYRKLALASAPQQALLAGATLDT